MRPSLGADLAGFLDADVLGKWNRERANTSQAERAVSTKVGKAAVITRYR